MCSEALKDGSIWYSPAHLRAEKTVPNQPISQKTQQALGGACNPIKKAENKTLNQRLVWGRPLLTSTWKAEEDPSLELRHSSLVKTQQLGESGKMAQWLGTLENTTTTTMKTCAMSLVGLNSKCYTGRNVNFKKNNFQKRGSYGDKWSSPPEYVQKLIPRCQIQGRLAFSSKMIPSWKCHFRATPKLENFNNNKTATQSTPSTQEIGKLKWKRVLVGKEPRV